MEKKTITILYIAGYGRSGSTLLDVLIGNGPNCAGLGELSNFYTDMLSNTVGENVAGDERKAFWLEIQDQACGTFMREKKLLPDAVDAQRGLENFFTSFFGFTNHHAKTVYSDTQNNLLKLISQKTKSRVLIDSSKSAWRTAWRPYWLAKLTNCQVIVIHLVRDSREVMRSQLRGDNIKMAKGLENAKMNFPVAKTIIGWNVANLTALLLRLLLPRNTVFTVFYNDLIKSPNKTLCRIGRSCEVDLSEVIRNLDSSSPLFSNFQYNGNRMLKKPVLGIRKTDNNSPPLAKWLGLVCFVLCGPLNTLLRVFCQKDTNKEEGD